MKKRDQVTNGQEETAMENKKPGVLASTFKWAFRLRSVVLAIPVAAGAVVLALYNQINLPDMVGINMQASGDFAFMIAKGVAVLVPLLITAVCLLLMFCSKKVLYPWLISIFSLALPLLLLFSNTFPG